VSRLASEEASRPARREFLAGLAIVLGVAGFVASKRIWRSIAASPTAEQCTALLDRYLDHKSRQRDPELDDNDIARAREKARADEPAYLSDLAACRDQLTAAEVECGIASSNVDDLERCVQ
jgi:hypothetical protein